MDLPVITEEHERAEKVASQLQIYREKYKIYNKNRRPAHALDIHKAYISLWGSNYINNPDYIIPERLLTLLGELNVLENLHDHPASDIDTTKYHKDIFEYVAFWWDSLGVSLNSDETLERMFEGSAHKYNLGLFLSHCKAFLPTYNNTITTEAKLAGVPHLLSETLGPALEVILHTKFMSKVQELRERLKYNPQSDTDVNKFIYGLLKIYFINPSPENIAAMKHLVWSIKRNIFGLPIPEPLFFSLHSNLQRMGKTEFFKRLCTGFEWIYSPSGVLSKLLHINDCKSMLRNKYLLDFQELAIGDIKDRATGLIDESSVAALKSIITTPVISGRQMYMSAESTERQTTTFVSSTNKHIYDVISDTSGMRRYWEFLIRPPKEFNFEFYLEANDYFANIVSLYESIDENNPVGFYHPDAEEYPAMRKIQDSYARKNTFLSFCETQGWEFSNELDPSASPIALSKLVTKFNDYLQARGDPKWTAKHVQFVVCAYADTLPEQVLENGRTRESYWMKGLK